MTSQEDQEEIASDNWGEDKGKMNEPIQKGTTRERDSGQNPRDKDTRHQTSQDGPCGYPKTESERFYFERCEMK